jgi:PLAC (protease and lacunin) domain
VAANKTSLETYKDNNSSSDDSGSNVIDTNTSKNSLSEDGQTRKSESGSDDVVSNDIMPTSKPSKLVKGPGCQDKFKNCNIVVQSRLCMYSFYQTNCCRSCSLTLP